MLTVLMFLAFISWGSALGAVFFRKKYEHTLLLTVTFTVFLIFSAGLLGSLRKGIHAAYGIGSISCLACPEAEDPGILQMFFYTGLFLLCAVDSADCNVPAGKVVQCLG